MKPLIQQRWEIDEDSSRHKDYWSKRYEKTAAQACKTLNLFRNMSCLGIVGPSLSHISWHLRPHTAWKLHKIPGIQAKKLRRNIFV